MRTHTRGYTGQKGVAFRTYVFDAKEIKESIEGFKHLTITKVDELRMPAIEFNQFIKGKSFVLTDCLMTSYKVYSKESANEEIELILDYSSAFIKYSCQWLRDFPSLYTNVIFYLSEIVQ